MGMSRRIWLAALGSTVLVVFAPGVASGQAEQPPYCYDTSVPDVDDGGSGGGEGGYVEGSEGGSPGSDGEGTTTPDSGAGSSDHEVGWAEEVVCYADGGAGGLPTTGGGNEGGEESDGDESGGVGAEDGASEEPEAQQENGEAEDCSSGDSGGLMPPDTMPADSDDGEDSVSSSAAGDLFCPPSIESVPVSGRPVGAVGAADGVAALPTRIDAGAGALASTGTSVLSLIAGAGALLAGGGALLAGADAGLRRRRRR